MRKLNLVLIALLVHGVSIAQTFENQISVRINGMVCSFCAQGISKKFKAIESIDNVKVDLDNKIVKLLTKKGKSISDEEIKEVVTDSGFNLEKIERNPQ